MFFVCLYNAQMCEWYQSSQLTPDTKAKRNVKKFQVLKLIFPLSCQIEKFVLVMLVLYQYEPFNNYGRPSFYPTSVVYITEFWVQSHVCKTEGNIV